MYGCRILGRRGKRERVGMRRVAFEETLDIISAAEQRVKCSTGVCYLFTFCPPGPEDLLKLTSQTAFLRMVSASRLASHFRAEASSASSASLPLSFAVAKHLVVLNVVKLSSCGRADT